MANEIISREYVEDVECLCGRKMIDKTQKMIDEHLVYYFRCRWCGKKLGPFPNDLELIISWQMLVSLEKSIREAARYIKGK